MKHRVLLAALLAALVMIACSKNSDEGPASAPPAAGADQSATMSAAADPQVHELHYPVADLEYPSYELTGVVTDVESE